MNISSTDFFLFGCYIQWINGTYMHKNLFETRVVVRWSDIFITDLFPQSSSPLHPYKDASHDTVAWSSVPCLLDITDLSLTSFSRSVLLSICPLFCPSRMEHCPHLQNGLMSLLLLSLPAALVSLFFAETMRE